MDATKQPGIGEQTRRQVATTFGLRGLGGAKLPASYATYRKIRKHPTVALARAVAVAPIVAADWSIEADDDAPDEWVAFIKEQFMPIREPFLETTLLGGIDFGHQCWEKVFAFKGGRFELRKLKPLLPDLTEIVVAEDSGAFVGFRQGNIEVPLEKSLLVSFRVEGTQWLGEPLLENVRETWNQWVEANSGAARYDRKVSGSHFVVRYPDGSCTDASGQEVSCTDMAQRLLTTLESSGSIAVPDSVASYVGELNQQQHGWSISILEDNGGRQPTFVERLVYLDKLICRALLVPERSVLEGQHGTLAEADSHADFALVSADLTHRAVVRTLNWHAVDQVLALNFGDEARGKVRLVASPILDAKLTFLREVYKAVLDNPSGFLQEFGLIDTDALKDSLGIPKAKEVASAGDDAAGGALPGVDAGNPMAATIRRLYRAAADAN